MFDSKLLNHLVSETIREHKPINITALSHVIEADILFKNKKGHKCIENIRDGKQRLLQPSFFVGTDWLVKNELAVYVAPKVDADNQQIDYLQILYSCLLRPDIAKYTDQLYEIKADQKYIEIEQEQDLLTPLLVMQFLQLLKEIVRKGLKKSYYSVERNLNGRIKGKVKVAQNIKRNLINNKKTSTICQYDVFGYDTIENRVLKHALKFVQRYLAQTSTLSLYAQPLVNYCQPAFVSVADDVDLNQLKNIKHNAFYKEYKEAIRIAKLILKRFGYHTRNAKSQATGKTSVPPFWIDMSKLFEFYTLGLLKDRYGQKLIFQAQGTYGQPDFLLRDETNRLILDAKYRPRYQDERYHIEDVRQLSGYARDTKLLSKLGYISEAEQDSAVVGCVLIYTDQKAEITLPEDLTANEIKGFSRFYKVPVAMPMIRRVSQTETIPDSV